MGCTGFSSTQGTPAPQLEDLEKAATKFNPVGGPEAWYRGCTVAARIMRRERVSRRSFLEGFVAGYLNRWRSRLPHASADDLLRAMSECRRRVRRLPSDLTEVGVDDLGRVWWAFDRILAVHHVGATTAAKALSAMKPRVLVMWDASIADRYGFAQNATGYCRFIWLMAELCRDVCVRCGVDTSRVGARELEQRLDLPPRRGLTPLAKLIDEWNWLTITQRQSV